MKQNKHTYLTRIKVFKNSNKLLMNERYLNISYYNSSKLVLTNIDDIIIH